MKHKFWPFLLLFLWMIFPVFAQETMVKTKDGKDVILNSDGTWKYANVNGEKSTEKEKNINIDVSNLQFVKSSKIPFGVWLDPKVWESEKNDETEPSEFSFKLKGEEGYGLMVNEPVAIPLESMKEIVVENMKKAEAEDVKVNEEEDRVINGLPVKYLQIDAKVSKVPVNYMVYIYSGEDETIQLFTYSFGKYFIKNRKQMENLMNGLAKEAN